MATAQTCSMTSEKQQQEAPGQNREECVEKRLARDLLGYLREYARERPSVVAACCLGVGFVLGWKLKP